MLTRNKDTTKIAAGANPVPPVKGAADPVPPVKGAEEKEEEKEEVADPVPPSIAGTVY